MSTSSNSHNSSPTTSPKTTFPTSSTTSQPPTTTTTTVSSPTKTQAAIESLSAILPTPLNLTTTSPSAAFLLTSSDVSTQISTLIRHPSSGSGDNHLCRWLYDTFQSSDPSLQLVILRFIPLISGIYLTRITQSQTLAGFEAVLLALYAHETTSRDGQATSVTIPDLSNPSIYHESNTLSRAQNSTDLNIAVISSSLDPHGTVRATRRARIVGVALELFYSKIWVMPIESKLDFCEFFEIWMGKTSKKGRIPLPWELLQPCLRILGHCLLGEDNGKNSTELREKARSACRSLYVRAMHDVNPKAILAAASLLKILKLEDDFDPTDIPNNRIISI